MHRHLYHAFIEGITTALIYVVLPTIAAVVVWVFAEIGLVVRRLRNVRSFGRTDFKKRAIVVVGGDFARSPRMQYHAVSLLRSKLFQEVHLVGIDEGNRLCEALQPTRDDDYSAAVQLDKAGLVTVSSSNRIANHPMIMKLPRRLRWLLVTLLRVFVFVVKFWSALRHSLQVSLTASDHDVVIPGVIFVQTPPAIPFVPLVKMTRIIFTFVNAAALWLVGASSPIHRVQLPKLFVDWHNFGFTLLKIDRRPIWIVQIYRWCEKYLCEGDYNLTVSQAMKQSLISRQGHPDIGPFRLRNVSVLYDTAPTFFRPVPRSHFSLRLARLAETPFPLTSGSIPRWFLDSCNRSDENEALNRRPMLAGGLCIVSSTSWGSDDDYTMVLDALKIVDANLSRGSATFAASGETVPFHDGVRHVWLVVTGKGPTRDAFEMQVANTVFASNAIDITTAYFQSFADYSMMLGAADLGLSVHYSSSGLDLPMKCVDMLGAGLPVAAVEYATLSELITPQKGWTFRTANQLADVIMRLMAIGGDDELAAKRAYVASTREHWDSSWTNTVRRLL